jgi:hypothetical protein
MRLKLLRFIGIRPHNDVITWDDETKTWYDSNDKPHRDDGPAVIYADGGEEWYQHGVRHRDDGPAAIFADGDKSWWQHGKLHRTDGPAHECANGTQSWCLYGKCQTFDEWLDEVKMSDEDKVMMMLKYG